MAFDLSYPVGLIFHSSIEYIALHIARIEREKRNKGYSKTF